jgi:Polyglycine hydrolase-like, structural repeat
MRHITQTARFFGLVSVLMAGIAPIGTADAGDRYATIWEKSSGPTWIAQHGIAAANYQTEFDKHVKDGYRLKLVSGYPAGGDARYTTIWEKSSGPDWIAQHGIVGEDSYQLEFDKRVKTATS